MKRQFSLLLFWSILVLGINPVLLIAQSQLNPRTHQQLSVDRLHHLERRTARIPLHSLNRLRHNVKANEQDSLALAALYQGTFGSTWTNSDGWLSSAMVNWHGVTLDENGRVRILNLTGNNLFGTLPAEMAQLTELDSLYLGSNSLAGGFPTFLPGLTTLEVLDLSNNFFKSTLPAGLGQMEGLIRLVLWGNDFSGELPSSLWDLPKLEEIAFFSNAFEGAISADIGNLQALRLLYLDDNKFSGELPASIGSLPVLQEIFLDLNNFEGAIPATWASLNTLSALFLSNNQLVGGIPDWLGDIETLRFISLSNNPLGGEIPESLGSLSGLSTLFLSNNELSGPFPESILGISSLTKLYLAQNNLQGLIPNSFSQALNLRELDISYNAFGGSVPTSIAGLTILSYLNLSHNLLSDRIPAEWRFLESIRWVYLNNNRIQGDVPPELFEWFLLNELDFSHNRLTGEIPPWIGQARFIRWFDLSNNQFSGQLPAQWEDLLAVEEIALDSNLISGTIPDTWAAISTLSKLVLTNNNLSSLPAVSVVTGIDTLDIRNNKLTFEDLEMKADELPGLIYHPQKSVPLIIGKDDNGFRTYAVAVEGTANAYQWFQNNSLVASAAGDQYSPGSDFSTNDTVYAKISNPLVQGLLLESERLPMDLVLQELEVMPDTLDIAANSSGSFRAFALNSIGDSIQVRPDWTVTGGSIDSEGRYLANTTEGWYLAEARFDTLIAQAVIRVEGVATAVSEEAVPDFFDLSVFPNPVSTQATIRIKLEKATRVDLHIVDVSGRAVGLITQFSLSDGLHEFNIPVHTLTPGMYFIVADFGQERIVKPVSVLR